ncbi:hypothetical protein AG0111_0g8102 [Alternaria gaisen]|uniref:Uncharacterized protein n=1 Tax=Alternaria gaisen TaxID=167740 RepID=A0ACB6FG79_9PLEO|nr:hypothetical protein AG0111_0g8102 [Alternaria gaisen]
MAGRILPVALATIVGVSIGVATFDGEFKKQRIARLEAEYKRELAAAAASTSTATPPPPAPGGRASTQLQTKKEDIVTSAPADNSWSNTLGLWAWKKDNKTESATAPATSSAENSKGKP